MNNISTLEYIEDYLNTKIKNDSNITSKLLRVCLSTYTNDPINIALLAPSSDGKTYATMEVTKLFPKEDVIVVGRMSPTALIHQQGELIDDKGNSLQDRLNIIDEKIQNATKEEKQNLQNQRKKFLSNARNCVDLTHKILLFLDNPTSSTYDMLKPIMSHDSKEINYKTTKGDGSLNVKESVIRGWPVFIFCSAKNEANNEVWEEIQTRVMVESPESTVTKYKEANRLTAQKMGLPDWASRVYHNDEDEKLVKSHIRKFKNKLTNLCNRGNPILNPLQSILAEIFPSNQGECMRHFKRVFSFIDLETMLNEENRPMYELKIGDVQNKAIVTTINDIEKACKIFGEISNVSPEKIKFYNEIFCNLIDIKTQKVQAKIDDVWLTSSELAEEYTKKFGKITSPKKILENYLQPLSDAGIIEVSKNPLRQNQNRFRESNSISTYNISNLKSKLIEEPNNIKSIVTSCLESIIKSSTKSNKYNEKITYENYEITLEKLIDVILGKHRIVN